MGEPADLWLALREDYDWFTPPGPDGEYRTPHDVWGCGKGLRRTQWVPRRNVHEEKKSNKLAPKTTRLLNTLARLYSDPTFEAAWADGWRWETQAPLITHHNFFPPQKLIDEFGEAEPICRMVTRGPQVGLSAPQVQVFLEGMYGDLEADQEGAAL